MSKLDLSKPIDLAVRPLGAVTPVSILTVAEVQALGNAGMEGVWLQCDAAAVTLGGSTVATTTGLTLTAGQALFLDIKYGTEWYAIAASGTPNLKRIPVVRQ